MLQYESKHSNQVHQLTISVSRHFYVTKEGIVKRQKKAFDITLDNCQKSGKTHLVNYIIRDHFSGMFYGAVATTERLRDAVDFLIEAWSKKSDYPFAGMPDYLVIAKSYQTTFPDLMPFLARQPIELIEARSGFQGGVRDIRTWEQFIADPIIDDDYKPSSFGLPQEPQTLEKVFARAPQVYRFACIGSGDDRSKAPKYLSNRPHCRMPIVARNRTQ